MKKIIITLGLAVIIVGAAIIFFVANNIEGFIVSMIEKTGSEVLQTEVTVDDIDVSIKKGSVGISGIGIGNPKGYSDNKALSFGEISIAVDFKNKAIEHIIAKSLHFRFEGDLQNNNFMAFQKAITPENSEETQESTENVKEPIQEEKKSSGDIITIKKILIEDVKLILDKKGAEKVEEVKLENFELVNLSGTPDQIASKIFEQLFQNSFRAIANQQFGDSIKELKGGFKSLMDGDSESAKKSAQNVEKKLSSLFGGNRSETESNESANKENPRDLGEAEKKISGFLNKFK